VAVFVPAVRIAAQLLGILRSAPGIQKVRTPVLITSTIDTLVLPSLGTYTSLSCMKRIRPKQAEVARTDGLEGPRHSLLANLFLLAAMKTRMTTHSKTNPIKRKEQDSRTN